MEKRGWKETRKRLLRSIKSNLVTAFICMNIGLVMTAWFVSQGEGGSLVRVLGRLWRLIVSLGTSITSF